MPYYIYSEQEHWVLYSNLNPHNNFSVEKCTVIKLLLI